MNTPTQNFTPTSQSLHSLAETLRDFKGSSTIINSRTPFLDIDTTEPMVDQELVVKREIIRDFFREIIDVIERRQIARIMAWVGSEGRLNLDPDTLAFEPLGIPNPYISTRQGGCIATVEAGLQKLNQTQLLTALGVDREEGTVRLGVKFILFQRLTRYVEINIGSLCDQVLRLPSPEDIPDAVRNLGKLTFEANERQLNLFIDSHYANRRSGIDQDFSLFGLRLKRSHTLPTKWIWERKIVRVLDYEVYTEIREVWEESKLILTAKNYVWPQNEYFRYRRHLSGYDSGSDL